MGPMGVLLMAALTCSLVGCFLILRNMAMLADALSHTILLGIVLMFLRVNDLDSPLLQVGAALFGMVTVNLIELLIKKFGLKSDEATGLVFPLFFAIGVIIISISLRNVHLSVDTVIMGEVLFTPLNTLSVLGYDFPVAFLQLFVVFVIALIFVFVCYQQLKISTFDPQFAQSIGIHVAIIHHIFMFLVSITMVVSFNAVGSILVISLLVAAPLSAYMISKQLRYMIPLALLIACVDAVLGSTVAEILNVSMSGMVAVESFLVFILIWIFNSNGFLGNILKRRSQQNIIIKKMLNKELEEGSINLRVLARQFAIRESRLKKIVNNMIVQNEVEFISEKSLIVSKKIKN